MLVCYKEIFGKIAITKVWGVLCGYSCCVVLLFNAACALTFSMYKNRVSSANSFVQDASGASHYVHPASLRGPSPLPSPANLRYKTINHSLIDLFYELKKLLYNISFELKDGMSLCSCQEVQIHPEACPLPTDGLWVCTLADDLPIYCPSESLQKFPLQKK